jgi:hypothetical protein
VSNSTPETIGEIEKLAIVILQRMEQLIGMHVSAAVTPLFRCLFASVPEPDSWFG